MLDGVLPNSNSLVPKFWDKLLIRDYLIKVNHYFKEYKNCFLMAQIFLSSLVMICTPPSSMFFPKEHNEVIFVSLSLIVLG